MQGGVLLMDFILIVWWALGVGLCLGLTGLSIEFHAITIKEKRGKIVILVLASLFLWPLIVGYYLGCFFKEN